MFFSEAIAQATTPAATQSPLMSMIPFVLIFFVMYFFMIRPQKKKMQEEQNFLSKLSNGEEVYTKSGMLGTIAGITEKIVTLEIADGVKMKVLKSHIGGSSKALLTATTDKK
jgi:preprotein translocase subunit YajC